ncbi:MAG: UDP-N-acetylmuramate dehydrogenase [Minisyncoccia bacterium]
MEILRDYDLTSLNTFGISARARFFAEVASEEDFKELFSSTEFKENEKLILGGGSNVLFTKDFDGIVILNKLKGIEIIEDGSESVLIKSMAGEKWHDLVIFTVERGLWGIENLSLIPGTAGASPIQNIGAYGSEFKDTLENIEAIDVKTGEKKIFTKEECEFGYRDSIFKNKLKGKYFIVSVTLKLSKVQKLNADYKALDSYLKENNIEIKSSKDVSDAVSKIRMSKLPDPKVLGNAGSFFKNVYVTKEKAQSLLDQYPDMPLFKECELIKIPAGWLVEQCGWKGQKVGNVGVHDKQALVLVNHGGARGSEVLDLADKIIESVYEKFELKLTPEVNLV